MIFHAIICHRINEYNAYFIFSLKQQSIIINSPIKLLSL